jgi:hypothetical protein
VFNFRELIRGRHNANNTGLAPEQQTAAEIIELGERRRGAQLAFEPGPAPFTPIVATAASIARAAAKVRGEMTAETTRESRAPNTLTSTEFIGEVQQALCAMHDPMHWAHQMARIYRAAIQAGRF